MRLLLALTALGIGGCCECPLHVPSGGPVLTPANGEIPPSPALLVDTESAERSTGPWVFRSRSQVEVETVAEPVWASGWWVRVRPETPLDETLTWSLTDAGRPLRVVPDDGVDPGVPAVVAEPWDGSDCDAAAVWTFSGLDPDVAFVEVAYGAALSPFESEDRLFVGVMDVLTVRCPQAWEEDLFFMMYVVWIWVVDVSGREGPWSEPFFPAEPP